MDGTAGEGRWEVSCCPRAAVLSLPSRGAAVSKRHAANPAFASCALGVRSRLDFFTSIIRQEIKVHC